MTVVLADPDVTVHCGDVLDVLPTLPAGSVDCVVTSPPYWGLRDYGAPGQLGLESTPDEYLGRMVGVFREVKRVLAPHGTCWINLGDAYCSGTGSGRSASAAKGAHVPTSWTKRCQPERIPTVAGLKPKDLVGIPWRVALALQADGWWLRADVIWSKPNPMPESVTDRPTKAHEYVFLLTKAPRYFYDAEAVREPAEWQRWGDQTNGKHEGSGSAASWIPARPKAELTGGRQAREYDAEHFKTTDERNTRYQGPNPNDGRRNLRSVWEIATQPYPEAHFATYPEELVRRCLLAGCPERVCVTCQKPTEQIVEYGDPAGRTPNDGAGYVSSVTQPHELVKHGSAGWTPNHHRPVTGEKWSDCGHGTWRPGIVLDPFLGSGTTAHVARKHGRHAVGVELNPDYCELAARRLAQLSLLAEAL